MSTFSIRALSTSIIVVLNSQSDHSNTPAMSESGSDHLMELCFHCMVLLAYAVADVRKKAL